MWLSIYQNIKYKNMTIYDNSARTTATSANEGRLKVDVSSKKNKKRKIINGKLKKYVRVIK